MLQGYWQMPLAAEAQGSVHHRHLRRSVYLHACAPRCFDRDGLLPKCDDRVVGRLDLQAKSGLMTS